MVGGESNKCVPIKYTVSGQEYETGTCVSFFPEGQEPAEGAIGCEQREVNGQKGTVCEYQDPSQERAELPAGVPTERAAARFAPRLAPGADLTDEQRERLEAVRSEVAVDESSKSSDEALADRLSKSSTVGTIVSAMFMFNPLVKILYTAGAFSFFSERDSRESREADAARDVVAKPVDGTAEAEGATEAGKLSGSRVVPEGSFAIPLYEDSGGKMRVQKDVLKLMLFDEAPLAMTPESMGGIIVFVEEQAAKNPGSNEVIVKISDILEVSNKEILKIKRAAMPDPMSARELKERAQDLADEAKSGGGKRGGRGGKRTGKGKKAGKAKKKSGGKNVMDLDL